MSGINEFERLNTRKVSVLQVGGFRPSGDLFASHFGLRTLGAEGEDWPTMDGKPLLFVCQLNLKAAPAVPALLQDIALITFFVDPKFGNLTKENGVDWCLRGYPSLSGLVAMTPPADAAKLKRGFECRWEALDDHPNYDDPERVVPDGFDDSEVELENLTRTKVGGYASSIQSERFGVRCRSLTIRVGDNPILPNRDREEAQGGHKFGHSQERPAETSNGGSDGKEMKREDLRWSGREDSNLRPPGPEPGALPG